jgi:hypothetical protein
MANLTIALAADLTGGGALAFALAVLLMLGLPLSLLLGLVLLVRRLMRRGWGRLVTPTTALKASLGKCVPPIARPASPGQNRSRLTPLGYARKQYYNLSVMNLQIKRRLWRRGSLTGVSRTAHRHRNQRLDLSQSEDEYFFRRTTW